jgi:hypothetical protein
MWIKHGEGGCKQRRLKGSMALKGENISKFLVFLITFVRGEKESHFCGSDEECSNMEIRENKNLVRINTILKGTGGFY